MVASAVRAVLAHCPPYQNTIEENQDSCFKTNVKPKWWLLGTNMTIRLEASANGTEILADTKSQWFIQGDVLNYYNTYIQNFLRDLRTELAKYSLTSQ